MDDSETRTLWCGNLSDKVTEEILYELFLQAAPLEQVRIPTDKNGRRANYGFVVVKHHISVIYAAQLLNGTRLFDRNITVKPRKPKGPRNTEQKVDFAFAGPPPQIILDNIKQTYQPTFCRDRNYSKPYHRNDNHTGRTNSRGNHRNNYDRHRRRYH